MANARRRILEITIAAALTLCAGLLLLSNAKSEDSHNSLDRVILGIASPLERAVAWVVGGVGDVGNRYVWLVDVDTENAELRAENERLRGELAIARAAVADTDALQALLAIRKRVRAKTIGARLISGSLSPDYRVVRIRLDRGEGEVTPGMPVVSGGGLVGRVESVIGETCEVLLVTDPRSSVDVILPDTGGRGVLSGVSNASRYVAKIEQLDRAQRIGVGDPVRTSGLGGEFPSGIALGTVAKVTADPSSLYQEVEVTPTVDFASIDRLLILLTVPPPPEEPSAPAEHGTSTDGKRVEGL